MFAALKEVSTKVKKELENLRLELRITYLSRNMPGEGLLNNHYTNKSPRNILNNAPKIIIASKVIIMIPISQLAPEIRPLERSSTPNVVPKTPAANPAMSQTRIMASIAAINAPLTSKPIEWTIVSRNGPN